MRVCSFVPTDREGKRGASEGLPASDARTRREGRDRSKDVEKGSLPSFLPSCPLFDIGGRDHRGGKGAKLIRV